MGFEPFVGLSIIGGWQPRRIQELKPGYYVGQANADTQVPTNTVWDRKSFGFGISLDVSIAKTIASAFATK
jgi:hypothetical protein